MGVDDELLPTGEEDAWRLLWLLAATEFIPDDDSKRLAKALIHTNGCVVSSRARHCFKNASAKRDAVGT